VQECRLAAPGRSYQRDELALSDRKRDVLECGPTMGCEPLFKPVDQEIVCHLQLLGVARQVCSREEMVKSLRVQSNPMPNGAQ
jgi:hypothetical protein